MTRELYISVDVEPDGHVPGTSSIVTGSGLRGAAARTGRRIRARLPWR